MKTEKCYNITFNSRGESDVTTATDWDTSRHTTIKDKMIFITESGKDTSVWYFDSGCSRHMTGNPNNLENIHYKSEGHVTFGDGEKGQIIASGTLNVHVLPRLPKVFLIQGLKANLISISQLCEDELKVEFSKEDCKMRTAAANRGVLCYQALLSPISCHRREGVEGRATSFGEEPRTTPRHELCRASSETGEGLPSPLTTTATPLLPEDFTGTRQPPSCYNSTREEDVVALLRPPPPEEKGDAGERKLLVGR
nr:uncharacterized protein LOC109187072 [Ipomoea batatas]